MYVCMYVCMHVYIVLCHRISTSSREMEIDLTEIGRGPLGYSITLYNIQCIHSYLKFLYGYDITRLFIPASQHDSISPFAHYTQDFIFIHRFTTFQPFSSIITMITRRKVCALDCLGADLFVHID